MRVGQPAAGQPVQRRHVDSPAVRGPRRATGVVVEDDEHIRRVLRRLLVEEGIPVGHGVTDVECDLAVELPRHDHSSSRSAMRRCTFGNLYVPSSSGCGRDVGAHDQRELSFRRRKPIGLRRLVRGRFVRQVQRQRSIRRERQFVRVEVDGADVVSAVGAVGGHEVVLVVHGQRPEAAPVPVHRWQRAWREGHRVVVPAVEERVSASVPRMKYIAS